MIVIQDIRWETQVGGMAITLRFNICTISLYAHTNDTWITNIFDPGQVGAIFCGSGRVSHLWFGFQLGKFPLKTSNCSIFLPSGQKNLSGSGQKVPRSKVGWPLIYCWSKVSSCWVRGHLYPMGLGFAQDKVGLAVISLGLKHSLSMQNLVMFDQVIHMWHS